MLQLQQQDMAAAKSLRAAFTKVHSFINIGNIFVYMYLTIKIGFYFIIKIYTVAFLSSVSMVDIL